MQQLGCESHSITCVSCYVHVYGNKVIIIIIISVVHLPASLSPVGSQQRPTGYGSSSDVTTDTSNAIDIASVVSQTKLSDQTKYNVIESLILNRKPHLQFNFPSKEYKDSRRQSGTMKRYCQHKWFEIFPFITYSTLEDGIYCLCCSVFRVKPKQGSRAKMMISKPYSNWKDAKV